MWVFELRRPMLASNCWNQNSTSAVCCSEPNMEIPVWLPGVLLWIQEIKVKTSPLGTTLCFKTHTHTGCQPAHGHWRNEQTNKNENVVRNNRNKIKIEPCWLWRSLLFFESFKECTMPSNLWTDKRTTILTDPSNKLRVHRWISQTGCFSVIYLITPTQCGKDRTSHIWRNS